MKHTFHCLPSCLLSPTDVSGGHLPNNYLTSNPCLRICFERNSSRKKKKGKKEGRGKEEGGKEERRWNERKEKKRNKELGKE